MCRMSMLTPKLNLKNFKITDNIDHSYIVNTDTQEEYKLELADTLFLRCIDGEKDIDSIKTEISELLDFEISSELVWKALDALSDIGILESRLAPPSGGQVTSRRGFLTKVAASLAFGSVIGTGQVFAYEQSEQASKESSAKSGASTSEQQAKSSGSGVTQEQATKAAEAKSQEQQAKTSQEESVKASAEQDTKVNNEISNKESAVKLSSGGNAIPVSAPATNSIFALGLTTAALLKFRQRRKSVADKEQPESKN